ncbi:MAG: FMN-binding protein, partial [Bacilli bacterium]
MKKKIIIISIILFGIVGIIVGISAYTKSFNENLENIEIGVVDLSTIDDGEYIGECSIFPIIVKVKVVVASHQITNVVILEHDNGQGEAAEAITS